MVLFKLIITLNIKSKFYKIRVSFLSLDFYLKVAYKKILIPAVNLARNKLSNL